MTGLVFESRMIDGMVTVPVTGEKVLDRKLHSAKARRGGRVV